MLDKNLNLPLFAHPLQQKYIIMWAELVIKANLFGGIDTLKSCKRPSLIARRLFILAVPQTAERSVGFTCSALVVLESQLCFTTVLFMQENGLQLQYVQQSINLIKHHVLTSVFRRNRQSSTSQYSSSQDTNQRIPWSQNS
jgi:hypothetical protein